MSNFQSGDFVKIKFEDHRLHNKVVKILYQIENGFYLIEDNNYSASISEKHLIKCNNLKSFT